MQGNPPLEKINAQEKQPEKTTDEEKEDIDEKENIEDVNENQQKNDVYQETIEKQTELINIEIKNIDTNKNGNGAINIFVQNYDPRYHLIRPIYNPDKGELSRTFEDMKQRISDSKELIRIFTDINKNVNYSSYVMGNYVDAIFSEKGFVHNIEKDDNTGCYLDKQKSEGKTCSMRALTNAYSDLTINNDGSFDLSPSFSYEGVISMRKYLNLEIKKNEEYAENEEIILYSFLKGVFLVPVIFNIEGGLEKIAFNEILPSYLERIGAFVVLGTNHYYVLCTKNNLKERGFIKKSNDYDKNTWYLLDSMDKVTVIGATSKLMNWIKSNLIGNEKYNIYFEIKFHAGYSGTNNQRAIFNKYISRYSKKGSDSNIYFHPLFLIDFFVLFSEQVSDIIVPFANLNRYHIPPLPLPLEIKSNSKGIPGWGIIGEEKLILDYTGEKDKGFLERVSFLVEARMICLEMYRYIGNVLEKSSKIINDFSAIESYENKEKVLFTNIFMKNFYLFTSFLSDIDALYGSNNFDVHRQKCLIFIYLCCMTSIYSNNSYFSGSLLCVRFLLRVYVALIGDINGFYTLINDQNQSWFWGFINKFPVKDNGEKEEYIKDMIGGIWLMKVDENIKKLRKSFYGMWTENKWGLPEMTLKIKFKESTIEVKETKEETSLTKDEGNVKGIVFKEIEKNIYNLFPLKN